MQEKIVWLVRLNSLLIQYFHLKRLTVNIFMLKCYCYCNWYWVIRSENTLMWEVIFSLCQLSFLYVMHCTRTWRCCFIKITHLLLSQQLIPPILSIMLCSERSVRNRKRKRERCFIFWETESLKERFCRFTPDSVDSL